MYVCNEVCQEDSHFLVYINHGWPWAGKVH